MTPFVLILSLSSPLALAAEDAPVTPIAEAVANQSANASIPTPARHEFTMMLSADVPTLLPSIGVEWAVTPHFSLTSRLGLGWMDTVALHEINGGMRGYLVGDFDRGLFLGARAGSTNFTPVTIGDEAFNAALFVGGKYTLALGLLAEGSVGVEGFMTEAMGLLLPTVNVGVGWSF